MRSLADQGDSRDWARRLLRKDAAGQYVAQIAREWAQDVLGIERPKKTTASVLARGQGQRRGAVYGR